MATWSTGPWPSARPSTAWWGSLSDTIPAIPGGGSILFGDATGESAIIEAGTAIRQQGGYQVATNFAQSTTPPEESTCWRYQTAVERLEGMEALSVEAMRDLLDAVHVDGPAHTLYSNVYDLKNKLVYLYYFHNYDQPVVLDLEEELARGYHAYDLPSLFPPNTAADDWAEPKLRRYETLVESRLDDNADPAVLQAYAGEYELPQGWGPPGETMTVVAGEQSLLLRFPDYRQHELFPESATEFYHVAFQESTFTIAYEARFGLDEDRRIEYLELGPGADAVRMDRLGPESFVPEVATPEPTATDAPSPTATPAATATPTHTTTPTATPTTTATPVEPAPAPPTASIVQATATVVEAATPTRTGRGRWFSLGLADRVRGDRGGCGRLGGHPRTQPGGHLTGFCKMLDSSGNLPLTSFFLVQRSR